MYSTTGVWFQRIRCIYNLLLGTSVLDSSVALVGQTYAYVTPGIFLAPRRTLTGKLRQQVLNLVGRFQLSFLYQPKFCTELETQTGRWVTSLGGRALFTIPNGAPG